MRIRTFLLICIFAISLLSCKKDVEQAVVEYQLDTSIPTGDHFFVNYLNEKGDTIVEHQHYGWRYPFNVAKPLNTYLKADVNPIDKYKLTIRILVNGTIVKQDSISIFSGGKRSLILQYKEN